MVQFVFIVAVIYHITQIKCVPTLVAVVVGLSCGLRLRVYFLLGFIHNVGHLIGPFKFVRAHWDLLLLPVCAVTVLFKLSRIRGMVHSTSPSKFSLPPSLGGKARSLLLLEGVCGQFLSLDWFWVFSGHLGLVGILAW